MSSELARLAGIGPKRLRALEASGLRTLRDFVYHLPRRYLDRTRLQSIASLREGEDAFFPARVESVATPPGRLVVRVGDATGEIDLVFFRGLPYLRRRFREGMRLALAGAVSSFRGETQLVHPEWEELEEGAEPVGSVLPVYPLTEAMQEARLEHRALQAAALEALARFSFSDPMGEEQREFLGLRPERDLLRLLHAPPSAAEIEGARQELKVRELWPFCLQLREARRARAGKGRGFNPSPLEDKARAALPFALTAGQEEALRRIGEGLGGNASYHALLQGDVGSGKTAVAFLATMRVLGSGAQAAWLAPTEILAEQHFRTLSPWLESCGVEAALLTGSVGAEPRARSVAGLGSGAIPLAVGTHALLSGDVVFADLGFAVVDEQHRFGVEQRAALAAKGREPHILFLSATPIPRTLAQAWYGDLDQVQVKDKPPGRLPVKTRLVTPDREDDMLSFLLREAEAGSQVYWVVPRIEEGEGAAVADALQRLRAAFGDKIRVEAVHGRMPAAEREKNLAAFRAGSLRVLVATTVIEVGVDVPAAKVMVVEGAERFGLAQLHQLRGRTGRGGGQAWCFLLESRAGWPPEAGERLREFAALDDGFAIAEMDLRRRGAGDLQGRQQSGFGALRFADWIEDAELFQRLREKAEGTGG